MLDVQWLLKHQDARTRSLISQMLEDYDVSSVDRLRQLVRTSGDGRTTVLGIWLLARASESRDSATTRVLLRCTQHHLGEVRAEAARSFAIRPTRSALRPLIEMLRLDAHLDSKTAAAYALGHMKFSEAEEVLRGVLDGEDDAKLRGMAAESLGILARISPSSVKSLINALSGPSAEVAFWAIVALGNHRVEEALPAIARLLHRNEIIDNTWSIADEAQEAIRRIRHAQ